MTEAERFEKIDIKKMNSSSNNFPNILNHLGNIMLYIILKLKSIRFLTIQILLSWIKVVFWSDQSRNQNLWR